VDSRSLPSVGGLATGLNSFHSEYESRWVGWADVDASDLGDADIEHVRDTLDREYGCTPVFLSAEDVAGFYEGFSNSTIWPLFHHFTQYAEFDRTTWESYVRVNGIFCDAVSAVAAGGHHLGARLPADAVARDAA